MAGEYREFDMQLDREMEEMEGEILATSQEIALDAYSSVKEKTPVDTGFALNSWFIDLGDDASRDDNGGVDTAAQDTVTVMDAKPFQAITIANGAEYIGALEDGHSNQAPNGMVSVTLAEMESKYRRVK